MILAFIIDIVTFGHFKKKRAELEGEEIASQTRLGHREASAREIDVFALEWPEEDEEKAFKE